MKKFLLAAMLFAAFTSPSMAALQVTVDDVGSILNQSLSLPAQDTPGIGIGFQEFFEFTLPTTEVVTLSMTDSATGSQQIKSGVISLNTWTSTSGVSPFVPLGSLIESASLINTIGGQGATVAPDSLAAGSYFAEVSGVSGLSPIHIAVDSTVTASTVVGSSVPEPSTWIMLAAGFAFIGWGSMRREKWRRKVSGGRLALN